jgi:hypothetical protein
MKLKIENYDKIKGYFNWGGWSIQKIEETGTQYHFELKNAFGRVLDVQLERIPVSGNETTAYQFEFWCWGHGNGNPAHQTPIREFLYYQQIKDKRLFSSALSNMIKKWTKG